MPDVLRHGKAAIILATWVLLLVLGTPLLDSTKGENYARRDQRRALRKEIGRPWSDIVFAAAWVNRNGRDDLVSALAVLEKPLANRQYWNLYPIWGPDWRSVDIEVDGVLVHRSQSREHAWLLPQLRERRICYPLNGLLTSGKPERRRDHLLEWIVRRALVDFPDAQEVRIVENAGPVPGLKHQPVRRVTAKAPNWLVTYEKLSGKASEEAP